MDLHLSLFLFGAVKILIVHIQHYLFVYLLVDKLAALPGTLAS